MKLNLCNVCLPLEEYFESICIAKIWIIVKFCVKKNVRWKFRCDSPNWENMKESEIQPKEINWMQFIRNKLRYSK